MARALPIILVALAVGTANAAPPRTEQERTEAAKTLVWRDGQELTLPISHGTLKAPLPAKQLLGTDAASLWEILNGVDAPPRTEAALFDPATKALVFYQKISDGYVRLDDWEDVDADAMLKSVTENTEKDNARRQGTGVPAIHVVGWLEQPKLDRAANVVHWSFEAKDEHDGPLVNSVALMLSRDGFEKLTWIGSKADATTGDLLTTARSSFAFPAGALYSDYKAGDKVAEYGIAGLVAAVLGVKLAAKLGILAAVVVFAKKFFFLLLIPLGIGLRWFRKLFNRNPPPSAPLT